MPEKLFLQTQIDGITTISLNRPDIGNRVSDAMAAELAAAISVASSDSKAIVLRGTGTDFCLGREVFGHQGELPEAYDLKQAIAPIFDLYNALRGSEVPTIAVVQGRATGFGCALAAVADISVATDSAKFQFSEMAHNIMPTMAMSSLVDRVALKALMYLIYSAEEIDADQALSFGMISKIVPAADLELGVDALLDNIKNAPLPAVKAVKEYARAAQSMDTRTATDFAKNLHATVNSSSRMGSKK